MKLHKVFIAGKYPQGDISEDDIKSIADSYDPTYHEAPLTLNHQKDGSALGWVDKVVAKGKDLFVSFKTVSDKAKELVSKGEYKRPSIEIADYDGKGKYLRAVSLVLFPAVKGLPEMQFKTLDNEAAIYFSEGTEINFENKTKKTMSDKIKKFKERLDLSAELTEEEVISAYDEKLTEVEDRIKALEAEVTDKENEIAKFKEQEIDSVIEFAVKEGKILPAQKESIKTFATADFTACKKYLDSLTVNGIFKKDQVKDKAAASTSYTYAEILKDPSLAKNFSEAEIEELRKKDSVFGN